MHILNAEGKLIEFDTSKITGVSDKDFIKIVPLGYGPECLVTDGYTTYNRCMKNIFHCNLFSYYCGLDGICACIISYSNSMFLCFESKSMEIIMESSKDIEMSNMLFHLTDDLFGIEIDDHVWTNSRLINMERIWSFSYNSEKYISILYIDPYKDLYVYNFGDNLHNKIKLPLHNVNYFNIHIYELTYCDDTGIYYVNDIRYCLYNNLFEPITQVSHPNIIKFMYVDSEIFFIDAIGDLYICEAEKQKIECSPKIIDFLYYRDNCDEILSFLSEDGYIYVKKVSINVLYGPLFKTENFNIFFKECQKIYVGPGATFSTFPKKFGVKSARK